MKWKFVDLSVPLEMTESEPEPVKIEWIDHRQGACLLLKESGISADCFPDGIGINLERVQLTSHSGTHVDAPIHYGPTSSEGKKARSIDEMPLEWFFGPGLVLDCRGKNNQVTEKEIKHALERQNLKLEPGDIVLINTSADSLWGQAEYFTNFRGISVEATEWLINHQIKVIGVDSFGFDPPFHKMIESYKQTGNPKALWPCHILGRKREYCQIERLANLALLPTDRKFLVACFPIKLKNCGASPSRVVALLNNEIL